MAGMATTDCVGFELRFSFAILNMIFLSPTVVHVFPLSKNKIMNPNLSQES